MHHPVCSIIRDSCRRGGLARGATSKSHRMQRELREEGASAVGVVDARLVVVVQQVAPRPRRLELVDKVGVRK